MPATVIIGLRGRRGEGQGDRLLACRSPGWSASRAATRRPPRSSSAARSSKLHLVKSGVLYPNMSRSWARRRLQPANLSRELDAMAAREWTPRGCASRTPPRNPALPRRQTGPPRRAWDARGSGRRAGGSGPPMPTAPPGSGSAWRTCWTRWPCATSWSGSSPTPTRAWPTWATTASPSSSRPSWRRLSAGAPASGRPSPTRPRSSRTPSGRATTSSSRERRAPCSTSTRLLPLRHLLQPGRRRGLHRWRDRAPPGLRGDRGDEGLHDAGGRRAVPHRAPRRDRRGDRHARPRVRDDDRPQATGRLVRRRPPPLRGRRQQRQQHRPQQAGLWPASTRSSLRSLRDRRPRVELAGPTPRGRHRARRSSAGSPAGRSNPRGTPPGRPAFQRRA